MTESSFGIMKNETPCAALIGVQNLERFKKAVSECIDCYNDRRIKSKAKWMPPGQMPGGIRVDEPREA